MPYAGSDLLGSSCLTSDGLQSIPSAISSRMECRSHSRRSSEP